jgi:hypothetical protein
VRNPAFSAHILRNLLTLRSLVQFLPRSTALLRGLLSWDAGLQRGRGLTHCVGSLPHPQILVLVLVSRRNLRRAKSAQSGAQSGIWRCAISRTLVHEPHGKQTLNTPSTELTMVTACQINAMADYFYFYFFLGFLVSFPRIFKVSADTTTRRKGSWPAQQQAARRKE